MIARRLAFVATIAIGLVPLAILLIGALRNVTTLPH